MYYFSYNKNKYDLTLREFEVLALLSKGWDNKKIADELIITIHTVKAHVANILRKMNVKNRTQAVLLAIRENVLKEFL